MKTSPPLPSGFMSSGKARLIPLLSCRFILTSLSAGKMHAASNEVGGSDATLWCLRALGHEVQKRISGSALSLCEQVHLSMAFSEALRPCLRLQSLSTLGEKLAFNFKASWAGLEGGFHLQLNGLRLQTQLSRVKGTTALQFNLGPEKARSEMELQRLMLFAFPSVASHAHPLHALEISTTSHRPCTASTEAPEKEEPSGQGRRAKTHRVNCSSVRSETPRPPQSLLEIRPSSRYSRLPLLQLPQIPVASPAPLTTPSVPPVQEVQAESESSDSEADSWKDEELGSSFRITERSSLEAERNLELRICQHYKNLQFQILETVFAEFFESLDELYSISKGRPEFEILTPCFGQKFCQALAEAPLEAQNTFRDLLKGYWAQKTWAAADVKGGIALPFSEPVRPKHILMLMMLSHEALSGASRVELESWDHHWEAFWKVNRSELHLMDWATAKLHQLQWCNCHEEDEGQASWVDEIRSQLMLREQERFKGLQASFLASQVAEATVNLRENFLEADSAAASSNCHLPFLKPGRFLRALKRRLPLVGPPRRRARC